MATTEDIDRAIVIVGSGIPTDRMMFEGVSFLDKKGKLVPLFTVSEVAKVFFGRSPHWIRWLEGEDAFVLDGKRVGDHRSDTGARSYTLADIELMAHALNANGAINGEQLYHALVMAETSGKIYGYIGSDIKKEDKDDGA